MKKRNYLFITLFALGLSLTSCNIGNYSGNNGTNTNGQPAEVVLESIKVINPPTKVEYFVGEYFDNTGLYVEATFSNESHKQILTYTIDKTEPLQLTDTKVVISYKGKTCEQPITVKEKVDDDDGFEEVKSSDIETIVPNDDGIDLHWGETYQIGFTYTPTDAHNPDFSYRSTNTSLATVSGSGLVTPTGTGEGLVEVVISHTNLNGRVVSSRVTFNIIKRIIVTELIPSETNIRLLKNGGTKSLSVGYLPENATETELIYTFDDNSIAEMNSDKTAVIGKAPGKTTLRISTAYTGDQAEAIVAIEVLDSEYNVLTVDNSLSPTRYGDYQDLEQSTGYDVLMSKVNEGDVAHIAVCPIEFTDSPFTSSTLQKLDVAFNGTGSDKTTGYWESVSSYFYKASHGKLNLQFDILDVYQTNQSSSDGPTESDYYQTIPTLMANCLTQHKTNHPDFNYANYDYDGNKTLDSVWTIYSCKDYSQDRTKNSNYWAYVTSTNKSIGTTGYKISRYGWASYDFMDNAGSSKVDAHTYIHETGHLLGLNDYYNYDNSSSANEPIGCFDMQSYNVGGHNAWSRVALGWENPVIYDTSKELGAYVHLGKGNDGHSLFITDNYRKTAFDEFLVVELYTPDGLNKLDSTTAYSGRQKMPSTYGVKIYHVDSRLIYAYTNSIGTAEQQQRYIDYSTITRGFPNPSMVAASNSSNYERNYTHELFDQIALVSSKKSGGSYMSRKTYSSAADFWQTGSVFTMEEYKASFHNGEAKLNNGSSLNIKMTFQSVTADGVDIFIEQL